jgi:gliding motility-associated-like protein
MLLCVVFAGSTAAQLPIRRYVVKDGKIIARQNDDGLNVPTVNSRKPLPQTQNRLTSAIVLNVTTSPSTCGYSNGSVIITASGGNSPYTYSSTMGWTQNTGYFPNVAAGTYTFTVTDANDQSTSIPVTVTSAIPGPSIAIINHTSVSTCTAGDGTVTVQASGGTPPYEYSIDMLNFQTNNVFSNISSGLYFFYVRDANGCIAHTDNFSFMNMGCTILPGIGFGYTSSCSNNGIIDLYVQPGGTGPYTFSFDGGPFNTITSWTGLPPGMHSILIKDVNNQLYLMNIPVPLLCGINISYVAVDAACGQTDGSLTITATGGATPYTYTIDGINYQSGNVFSGLAPGNYYVTAKDANGITSSRLCNVFDRCPVVTLTATGETCLHNDGSITATAVRGTAPYQYSIDGVNFQSSNVFMGLAAGNYTVTLKDALGFTATATTTINYNCLAVTAIHTNVVCGNMNGTITAIGSGGGPPYQYSIDGINFQSSNLFNGLGAASYTITVKDVTGQTATTLVLITDSPGPIVTVTSTPTSCTINDGTLTITPIGGTPPYTFTLDNINYQTSNVFTNLGVNNYFASAKDANGCQWGITQWVEWDCPAITTNITSETCGSANGTISVTVVNATPPFQYSLDGINFQSSPVFSGLTAGGYTITVRTALNHTNTATATISNTCPIVSATASDGTCGNANASITAAGANGTPPYQYSIDGVNFQNGNSFINLTSGSYTITIKDANGLTNTTTVAVLNFPGPTLDVATNAATCLNNNVHIQMLPIGGSSPFVFSLDGVNFQSSDVFDNQTFGTYTATVRDVNGCIASRSFTVPLISNLVVTPGNNVLICEGSNTVLPVTSNGASFIWTPSVGLDNINQLNPHASPTVTTKYYIIVTLGVCSKTDSITVVVNRAPLANAGMDSIICPGQSVRLNGSGGVIYDWMPSTYLSDPHISDPVVLSPSSSISYSLQVTDALGCKSLQNSSIRITVTPPPKVFAGNDTAIVMNQPFLLKAVDVNNSGFIQYSWSPGFGLNNDNIQNPIAVLDRNMTYILTAVTAAGCQGTDQVSINVYKGPDIYVASAFTPNNDGRNDMLKAIPVGIKEFKYFIVYNRWGQQIFYTRDPSNGWNGKNQDFLMGTGVYVWMAEGIDDKGNSINRKGTVTLIR